jgi:hypothetical protein
MSTQAQPSTGNAIAVEAFPNQQSVIEPGAGTGNVSLYLAGSPGASILNIYFVAGPGDVQVFYGQNSTYPNTPLPQGTSQYPLADGFNILWTSDGTPFKLVWGVS